MRFDIPSAKENTFNNMEQVSSEDSESADGPAGSTADFDHLIHRLGEFGPYQKWLYAFMWFPAASFSIGIYVYVFQEFTPSYKCHLDLDLIQDNCSNLSGNWTQYYDLQCEVPKSLGMNSSSCKHISIKKNVVGWMFIVRARFARSDTNLRQNLFQWWLFRALGGLWNVRTILEL